MVLSPRLQIKQSQKLMMNPQMQQAIQLLQLTNVELNDMLAVEMEKNPFLAFDAADYQNAEAARQARVRETDTQTPHQQAAQEAPPAGTKDEAPLRDAISVRELSATHLSQEDAGDYIDQLAAQDNSLSEHLLQQIRLSPLTGDALRVAQDLVGWLDDDGYLRESNEALCDAVATTQPVLIEVLLVLQGLEPVGVFARDLPDCLALQLRHRGQWTPIYETILSRLDMLARGELGALATLCGVDEAGLRDHLSVVQALDPRPAASHDATDEIIRAPDILVRRETQGWRAYLNEDTLPKVLVLERDWEEMAERKMTSKEKKFMKSNVQSARWLRKATQQRAATMLRVARAVVARQQEFFDTGMEALRPMVLRDIADALEVHESTVSRVVSSKLVQTPSGLLSLKDLFSVGLARPTKAASPDGETQAKTNHPQVSAASIKARLAREIGQEQADNILSDEKLVQIFAEDGIVIARRTIAKYREGLNIGSSAARRRAAKLRPS
jgi:RNA polymerase sigma-54 factor